MDYMQMKRVGPVPAGYPFTNADWNRSLTTFSFNSGLVWNVDQADAIRVTAARGIVMPSLAFSGGFVSPTPIGTFGGNPNLRPTAVTNFEGGWDHALSALNAHFEMVVFYQQSRDVVSLQGQVLFTPTGLLFSQDNVGDSNSVGVTVRLKGQILNAWQWELNGRYQSITDAFRPGIAYLDFAHAVPRYTLNARLGWSGGPWEIDGYIHYQTRTSGLQSTLTGGTMLVPVPDFAAVDGRIGYALTDAMTLAVSGQNLLTDSQRQTSSRPVERRVLGTISFRF
jgi:iron complex outermembrane receptor protein